MSSWEFATKISRFTTAATHTVESGEFVRVWGSIFTNKNAGSAVTVSVRETGTSTVIFDVRLAANTTVVQDFAWIADKGIDVVIADSSVEVAIFHSNPGS